MPDPVVNHVSLEIYPRPLRDLASTLMVYVVTGRSPVIRTTGGFEAGTIM